MLKDDPLAKLEDPETPVTEISDILKELTGQRERIRVDSTDPPAPPRAIIGSLEAEGKDPDDALRNLGALYVREFRKAQAEAAEAAKAKPDESEG